MSVGAVIHGALWVDGGGQQAVGAPSAAMSVELRGGQGGQDTGSSRGGGAGRDEAVLTALESRRSQHGVSQHTGQEVFRSSGRVSGLQGGAEWSLRQELLCAGTC